MLGPTADESVDAHGKQDDEAIDALEPKRIDPHQSKTVLDYQQRKRAERHPEHRARAAADGDAADDDRGDDCQLEAERDTRVDSRVARRP